ncbi:MAG: 50S ribosomal protein L11 methyltransferase [Pacificimonas sp.]
MTHGWKTTLPISKADADMLTPDLPALEHLDPQPALITNEPDPSRPDDLELHVYSEQQPDEAFITLIKSLLSSSPDAEAATELLPDEDWVMKSQEGLDPIRAGRFWVHAARDRSTQPADSIGLQIEASQAFGTGHHPTTAGCLRAIDQLTETSRDALDLGTGTALLALAIVKRFREARVTASDIDPVSIDVSRENVEINAERAGDAPGEVFVIVADGFADPALSSREPYDLIVANILAQPLIDMANEIAAATRPGGTVILAGLLTDQQDAVRSAFTASGLVSQHVDPNEGWPILTLKRPD